MISLVERAEGEKTILAVYKCINPLTENPVLGILNKLFPNTEVTHELRFRAGEDIPPSITCPDGHGTSNLKYTS